MEHLFYFSTNICALVGMVHNIDVNPVLCIRKSGPTTFYQYNEKNNRDKKLGSQY